MKNYAVIRINGRQYKVSENDEILVPGKYDEKSDAEVLLRVKDNNVLLGKPVIDKLSFKLKLIEDNIKGKKIDVLKYKAKSRYRKKIGFRSVSSKLQVEKLD